MNIQVHAIAYNEVETIRLFIRHYQAIGATVKIHDNFSDDGTPEMCRLLGCEVETFGIKGELNDAHYLRVKNRCWKGSTADWVIICDADEILQVSRETLEEATKIGSTIFHTQGYNVYSHDMPVNSYSEINTCIPDSNYSKSVIFNPKAITDISYQFGAHKATPAGTVNYHPETLKLFHYRAIGGPERMVKRHALYRNRMSQFNKTLNLGLHYNYSDEQRIKEWYDYYDLCVKYSQVGI